MMQVLAYECSANITVNCMGHGLCDPFAVIQFEVLCMLCQHAWD